MLCQDRFGDFVLNIDPSIRGRFNMCKVETMWPRG